jgi:hypothetical protein
MTPNVQIKTLTLVSGQNVAVAVSGTFLMFVSNQGTFDFSLDGGNYQTGFSILGIDVSQNPSSLGSVTPVPGTAPSFKEILLRNTSGAANTITFIVSDYPVTFINPNATNFTKNAPTYCKGSGLVNIADGGNEVFTGVDAGGQIRKLIIVCNASANTVYIADASSNIGDVVPAGQSHALEVAGTVKVINIVGSGASSVAVMEVFYV